jgi:hypothetical protein
MITLLIVAVALALASVVVANLTPSKTYMNWDAVGFTATGGSLIPITRVSSIKIDRGGNPEYFKGDMAVYPQVAAVPDRMRSVTVTSGDLAKIVGLVQGAVGVLTFTLPDAINGVAATGGGVVYTLSPCIIATDSGDGTHAKFASGSVTFVGYVLDGTTDPLTSVAL